MFPLSSDLALLLARERIADAHRKADQRRRVTDTQTKSSLRGLAVWRVRRHPTPVRRRDPDVSGPKEVLACGEDFDVIPAPAETS